MRERSERTSTHTWETLRHVSTICFTRALPVPMLRQVSISISISISISGEGGPKMVLPSRRNAHFEKKWCSRRGETLVFTCWEALGLKSGALVEAKRSFSHFGLFLSSLGTGHGPQWPRIAPRWLQVGQRWSQDGPKLAHDRPKLAPRRPKGFQEGPKTAQEGSKMGPRWHREAAKRSQDGLQVGQDGQRAAQVGPRGPQDGPG